LFASQAIAIAGWPRTPAARPFRTVNLAEVARDVVELFDAAAEVKGVHLAASGRPEVLITGDRDLLFDAVSNLVDNAIKHGRDAGHVKVTVTHDSEGPMISVIDDGPGIPADQVSHVFKRFYRLEHSRRAPGNGLGLSLVAAVARLHGARIEIADAAPGLVFRLHFGATGMNPEDGVAAEVRPVAMSRT
jgi:signal transduction histidine kinase